MLRYIRTESLTIGMIVVDEIHTLLTSLDFRAVLVSIGSLMETSIPVTFLSATIPICLEEKLKQLVLIPEEHNFIRVKTGRPEHQYSLFSMKNEELVERVTAFAQLSSERFLQGTKRGIPFVRSKDIGYQLKQAFPTMDFIHEGIEEEERHRVMEKWKQGGSGGWIIGTTSLTQGVDYHNVHLVVFAGAPFSMIDFVQGAGRAGRNGKPSKVVVFRGGRLPSLQDEEDLSCKREMNDWLERARCRRLGISECMDREHHSCNSLEGASPCDSCCPDDEMVQLWRDTQAYQVSGGRGNLAPNLHGATSISSSLKEPKMLEVLPLQPQLARPEVLQKSEVELALRLSRLEKAGHCVHLLRAFSPNCAICYSESGGVKLTGGKHKTIKMCKPGYGDHFKTYYNFNSPQKVRRNPERENLLLMSLNRVNGCTTTQLVLGALPVHYLKRC